MPDPLSETLQALQEEANQRNQDAAKAGLTDRWCACKSPAIVAVGHARQTEGNPEGVARWLCPDCFNDWKRRKEA